jgi:hypothetical protein
MAGIKNSHGVIAISLRLYQLCFAGALFRGEVVAIVTPRREFRDY